MPAALQTVHSIADAKATVDLRLALTVFVRGAFDDESVWIDDLWRHSSGCVNGRRLAWWRGGTDVPWRCVPEDLDLDGGGAASVRGLVRRLGVVQIASSATEGPDASSVALELADMPDVLGLPRASHVRFLFDERAPALETSSWINWILGHIPVWWASAGYVFHHTEGYRDVAHQRIAALAKRYWCAQIQDLTALSWDALRGMPSVNWMSVVGRDFALQQGTSIEEIASSVATAGYSGVFHRSGPFGMAIAAGPKPVLGDINTGEDLSPYLNVANLLKPLLLAEHTPLSGPFAFPESMNAWLHRFEEPDDWLSCDISAE